MCRKFPQTTPLSEADVKRYRGLAMRINYLALDRPDVAYSSKELARGMQSPNVGHWSGLKRIARYLLGCPRMVWRYDDQDECGTLTMYTDSDDAGCLRTRKSTSCGALMHGRHLLKFYSSTQHVVSLSSGESEFYAGIKAGSTLLGTLAIMKDFSFSFEGHLVFDASAAKSLMSRRRHGRAKHIDRCYLWLQQRIHEGDLTLKKVGTAKNVADLGTKYLEEARIRELIELMALHVVEGQHAMALGR